MVKVERGMRKKEFSWKIWITVVATILGIVVSGFTIYDRINEKNKRILLEQSIDPNVLKGFHERGMEVTIEKGITIRPTNPDEPMVGNDVDEHGCKISAGYTWNNDKQECVREWESNVENQPTTE